MILSVFCPLEVKSVSMNEFWIEISPNVPNTQRPYMLQLGKESYEAFQAQSPVQKDIKQLENGVEIEGKKVKVQAFFTCDRKASDKASDIFGNGGAYCDLCTRTKKECQDIDIVKSGFEINKTVEQMHGIFESLEIDGEIVKSAGDYATRQGQCYKPIAGHKVKSNQVLHGLFRSFDHFMAALVRCYAGVYSWGVPTGSWDKTLLDRHKTMLQDPIEAETGIQWDKPDPTGKGGTTTTGNTGRSLLHLHRDVIVSLLPNKHKPLFEKWGWLLSVLI